MKVELISRYAGPGGTFPPGTVIDVSDDEGQALVSGGYAKRLRGRPPASEEQPKKKKAPAKKPVESASVEQDETATTPPPRPRRKPKETEE